MRTVFATVLLAATACSGSEQLAVSVTPPPTEVIETVENPSGPTPTSVAPSVPTPPPVMSDVEAVVPVRIAYGELPDQYGDLWLPMVDSAPESPVVVLIHGGFWREPFQLDLMDPLAVDLAARGIVTWNIEYRRVGGTGGWPQTGDDVALAIDELSAIAESYAIDLDRVILVGHSAGGHLALWALDQTAAVTPIGAVGLGAVVELAYFAEAQGLLDGSIVDSPDLYADAAPSLDPDRVTLVHAADDRIVPGASLRMARDAGVTIATIPDEGHFDLIEPGSESWAAALDQIAAFAGLRG